jgi:hypothetical protein
MTKQSLTNKTDKTDKTNETNEINKKISKVKKNINIFKKDKTVKIKLSSKEPKKKSMDDALKSNEVLLWGLNRIDSILLSKYPNKKNNYNKKINNQEIINKKIKLLDEIQKTLDTEYNPFHTYNICDLDFLNLEYDRIENKISQMLDLNDEYDNLLDLQDSLTELINELTEQSKENNPNCVVQNPIADIIANSSNLNDDNANDTTNTTDNQILIEVEIDKNKKKSTKSIKSTRMGKTVKTKKLKPYYFIGEIPDGYREATEEEAIVNKKVSFYGKKRVNRELNSLFEITGTIYMDMTDKGELNKHIMALKGKLTYYKKEIEYHKISLDNDTNTDEIKDELKDKINETKKYYKKTLDVYNFYVSKFNKLNNVEINK